MGKQAAAAVDQEALREEIRSILIGLARTGQTISYSGLAMVVQTATMHHRAPLFHRLLREVCHEEIEAGRPIIGVLVVNKQTGICGAGFFKFCASLGCEVIDVEAFWKQEFERVCAYWSEVRGEYDDIS